MAQTLEESVFPLIGICHAQASAEGCRAAGGGSQGAVVARVAAIDQRQLENQAAESWGI